MKCPAKNKDLYYLLLKAIMKGIVNHLVHKAAPIKSRHKTYNELITYFSQDSIT